MKIKQIEQCTCGHAADRHGMNAKGICTAGPPCECLAYESWITPEMALANSRRIASDNADLFAIANKAVEEMRALVGTWRTKEHFADSVGSGHGYIWCRAADAAEAILKRFDTAIKDAIK